MPDTATFWNYCREREAMRLRREAGAAPPWSHDAVMAATRLPNLDRRDDRRTRDLFYMCQRSESSLAAVATVVRSRYNGTVASFYDELAAAVTEERAAVGRPVPLQWMLNCMVETSVMAGRNQARHQALECCKDMTLPLFASWPLVDPASDVPLDPAVKAALRELPGVGLGRLLEEGAAAPPTVATRWSPLLVVTALLSYHRYCRACRGETVPLYNKRTETLPQGNT